MSMAAQAVALRAVWLWRSCASRAHTVAVAVITWQMLHCSLVEHIAVLRPAFTALILYSDRASSTGTIERRTPTAHLRRCKSSTQLLSRRHGAAIMPAAGARCALGPVTAAASETEQPVELASRACVAPSDIFVAHAKQPHGPRFAFCKRKFTRSHENPMDLRHLQN